MGFFNHNDIEDLILNNDVDGLVKCLYSGDASTRFQAAEALARSGNWKGFTFLILSLRRDKPAIRGAAAETLGQIKDARAVPALSRSLHDEDPEVQQAVVDALQAINTSEALDAIARMNITDSTGGEDQDAGHEPNPTISDAIFGQIGQVEDTTSGISSAELQHRADQHYILASKYFEEDRFTQALNEANLALELSPRWSEASNLKGQILEALGEHYQALVAYKKAIFLDENSLEAKENLANLTGILDIPSTPLQELLDGLNSEEWDMRRDAVAALSAKTEPEALPAIIRALYDEDLEVRAVALEVLECSVDAEAVNAVQKYYAEFDVDETDEDQETDTSQINATRRIASEPEAAEQPVSVPEHRSTRDYVEAASNLIDEEEYAQAFVQCKLALFSDPYNSDALNMLGIIHEENDEYRQAYFCYKDAISCDPSFEEARSNLDEIVREYGDENTNVQTLINDLESGEDELTYDAVVNLGELHNQEAIEHLMVVLKRPSRKIVLAAIQSLENLHALEAAESIASIYTDLWFFPVSPDKMTLDQIEKSRDQCIGDWADRCKIILTLGKLGATSWLMRSLEREFIRLKQLSHSFSLVGIDDFQAIHQVTLDLAMFIMEKCIDPNELKALESEMMSKIAKNGNNGEDLLKYSEIPAMIKKITSK